MPTTYAHYRFGKDVFDMLPEQIQDEIRPHRQLFDIGLHGPDILFYDNPFRKNSVNMLGRTIHKQAGHVFFAQAKDICDKSLCRRKLRAYLYGFICHYTLDYTCHPYIQKMINESGIHHNKIEAEFDSYLMRKDGLDPEKTLPIHHLKPTADVTLVISECFPSVSARQIRKTLHWMRLMLRLIHAPRGFKRIAVLAALKMIHQYDSLGGLIMSPVSDPDCQYYCCLLDDLYSKAKNECLHNIEHYRDTLFEGVPLPECFDRNFSYGKHWKELSLEGICSSTDETPVSIV